MKVFQNVRSTAKHVPYIEVNKDTVYARSDIRWIEEIDFSGWLIGQEIQYNKNRYIESLANEQDAGMLALMVSMLMSEVDMLKSIIMGGNQ